jgi:hypothetical protein
MFNKWKREKYLDRDFITFNQLAKLLAFDFNTFWWGHKFELEKLYTLGLAPAVKKHGRPYATKETLAAWWKHQDLLKESKERIAGAA